ncbi:GGDEF domain-containing protein [Comamonas thiooxydans]|uniref:diguanylate cyclase n=1 Tax=Comamonas thiooxydans TaxID=363952 RepID=A0A0E3BTC3_9BURK|nr:GGDEF domain-containing protein [Comamonas thiooxydans]KGH10430.1 diguanylate cyclase [Comamonas thiooxydans]KGH18184.1 diguanylate cyclase [Comamonas thiooxydans]KGH22389.1 diguanylate cyclase [Comamonas thiooxydans]
MVLDPFTLLVLSAAMAAASALYLAAEWSSVRERSLLLWSAGFAIIAVGSVLALLRSSGYVLFGIWFPNGLLISAHWLFLVGVAGFTRTRLPRTWWLLAVVWLAMLFLPDGPWWSKTMLGIQSLMIAVITLRAGLLLRPHGAALSVGAAQLRFVLLAHGLFYLAKAGSAVAPDAFVNLASFRGAVILVSLVEGVMAIMLLAMSMTGTERHRREERIAQIAARDPLTALDNRRALYLRAPELLRQASPASPGALLLIDIDHFKQVNDLHGHDAGDRLLVTLSDLIRGLLPHGAQAARLGGDEFVILLRSVSGAVAQELGQNLRESFAQQARAMFATPEPVSLSIGATLFDQPETELPHWLKRADEALYASKRKGRDRMELAPLLPGRSQ